jgi:hypothetical protein
LQAEHRLSRETGPETAMRDLKSRELAQQGLQYVEDAVVGLLTSHPEGMTTARIADALGLGSDLEPDHRDLIVAGILELLVKSGRIHWDKDAQIYRDNPDRL